MTSAYNVVARQYFIEFAHKVKATILFNNREYKITLTANKIPKQNLATSWSFWSKKVFKHWDLIDTLQFIKTFPGIDKLEYKIEELLAIILSIPNAQTRLKVMKAM